VNTLANMLGSPVTDATGLNALYNFSLDWSEGGPAAPLNAGPSLFDAVEQELGLKLVGKKPQAIYWSSITRKRAPRTSLYSRSPTLPQPSSEQFCGRRGKR
jgi:hypothetical protein